MTEKEFIKVVELILRDKLLVVPDVVEIKKDKKTSYIKAFGVHPLPQEDLYFAPHRNLRLCMPLSATQNPNFSMTRNIPEPIVLENGRKSQKYFKLTNLTFGKKIKDLDKRERKIFSQYIDLNEEDPEREVPKAVAVGVMLPFTDHNKVLSREYTYSEVIECCARDLYKRIYLTELRKLLAKKKGKARDTFEPNDEQILAIQEKTIKFLTQFDAIEIGMSMDNSIFLNYQMEGYDPTATYEEHKLLFYKLPCKTPEEEEIKKRIDFKVEERKTDVRIAKERELSQN